VVCRLASITAGTVQPLQDFSAVLIVATRQAPGLDGCGPTAATEGDHTQATTQPKLSGSAVPRRAPQPRQGTSKRRTVPVAAPEAFQNFPDHAGQVPGLRAAPGSQYSATACQGSDMLPTQPGTPNPPTQNASMQVPRQVSSGPPGMVLGQQPLAPWASSAKAADAVTQPSLAATAMLQRQPLHSDVPGGRGAAVGHVPTVAPIPMRPDAIHQGLHPSTVTHQGQAISPMMPAPGPLAGTDWVMGAAPASPAAAAAAATAVGAQAQPGSGAWWQGGRVPPHEVLAARQPGAQVMLASQLANALQVPDSDDELIGADPDEVAFAGGAREEESVDWFDVDKLW